MRALIIGLTMLMVALFTALTVRVICWVCGVQMEEMGRELTAICSLVLGFMGGGVGGSAIADEVPRG